MMESWRVALTKLHQASLTPNSLHGIPLFIINRDDTNDDERQQQKGIAHLSAHSRWEVAVGNGHFVQLERPDLLLEAVRDVIRAAHDSVGW